MSQVLTTSQVDFSAYSRLSQDYEVMLDRYDIIIRALRNEKMPLTSRAVYIALVDTWPDTLTGERIAVNSETLRANAGVAERSVKSFFHDMKEIEAGWHEPGSRGICGYFTCNIDLFPYPERFDMRNTQERAKGRAREAEKRDKIRLILECEECHAGPEYIKYGLLPTCKNCGHKHQIIRNVPATALTVNIPDDDRNNLPDLDASEIEQARTRVNRALSKVELQPAPAAPVAFTDVPTGEKWARNCRQWALHRGEWKQTLSGLRCPKCEPAYAI
jgi:hypothetical protein